jgi:hypothetical protein
MADIELEDGLDETPNEDSSPDAERSGGRRLDPDTILDTLVPSAIDWRGTVRRHPLSSIAAVGLFGYLVGRTKGTAIMAGLTTGLSSALMRQLSEVFEGDLFDFD